MKGKDIEREYIRVKKSLEVLGYRDPLGIDSVSIVNKVLNDLIKNIYLNQTVKEQLILL